MDQTWPRLDIGAQFHRPEAMPITNNSILCTNKMLLGSIRPTKGWYICSSSKWLDACRPAISNCGYCNAGLSPLEDGGTDRSQALSEGILLEGLRNPKTFEENQWKCTGGHTAWRQMSWEKPLRWFIWISIQLKGGSKKYSNSREESPHSLAPGQEWGSQIQNRTQNKCHATVQKIAKKLKPQHFVPFEAQNCFNWSVQLMAEYEETFNITMGK